MKIKMAKKNSGGFKMMILRNATRTPIWYWHLFAMSADHLVIASLTFTDSPVSDGNAPHIVIYYLATNVFFCI